MTNRTDPSVGGTRPPRRQLANALRALAMDAVQQANSGHPGMPMGMADIAEVLWNDFLRHDPADPHWPDRDRFVLSNGHGSMLHYALLHLTGYELGIEELRRFRQLHSRTPGHPEYGETPGIETTTGPLGQGLATAVGFALAERLLGAEFNRPMHTVVDHHTYVFVGDGCLMEGISHEACSLAGTLGLGKLIAVYDDNGISIDGDVQGWFTDDTPSRFEAYGWHVVREVDGHDAEAVRRALEAARAETARPSLICCKTLIGWGSPGKQGSETCHGAALGAEEVARTREHIAWPHPPFVVPEALYAAWNARPRGAELQRAWRERFAAYRDKHPELAAEFERRVVARRLPADWPERCAQFIAATAAKGETLATRKASQKAIDAYAAVLPELLGGSADLTESNLTRWDRAVAVGPTGGGNYVSYGVREFAMTAITNGLALHGGLIPLAGTFLVFSDYARNAVRLAAMMKAGSILVYTHDSIGLGEDGPTHQPVEQLASLRVMPNLSLWRPCDATETAVAWKAAIERRDGPTALALTRQNVPPMPRDAARVDAIARGGYVLADCEGTPDALLIATGSEVALAAKALQQLTAAGRRVRLVSMPSTDVFDAQDAAYREAVLPAAVGARVAVEAGATGGWWKYVGLGGRVIGLDRFGASAPAAKVYEHFGIDVEHIVAAVEALCAAPRP